MSLIAGHSQPTINDWYSLGRPQTEMLSIKVTDSCYYSSLIAIDNDTNLIWDQFFLTIDFNGNVTNQKFLHSDTSHINGYGSELINSTDGSFATICDFGDYFLFCKYDPIDDTICQVLIDSLFDHHNLSSGGQGKIIQREADSTYYFISQVQNMTDMSIHLAVIHLNNNGLLQNFEVFPLDTGFYNFRAEDIIDQGDGICFSSFILKVGGTNVDDRRHVRLIKLDYNLNLIWTWTDWNNLLDSYPSGITTTSDGGLIYGGKSGEYLSQSNSFNYKARITKLKNDFTIDWELELEESFNPDFIGFNDIIQISDSRFVATGNKLTDSMTVGWLIEFDIDGNLKWESEFNFAPVSLNSNPKHLLLDVEKTPDNGYILSGTAHNTEMTNQGVFGRFGWIVKTDSVGCLVPGCQDFLSQDEPENFEIEMYPNPATDYMYVKTSQHIEGNIQIFDMTGKLVLGWKSQPYNMSYIIDVSTLDPGNYILKTDNDMVRGEQFVVVR